jgi:hypothetical protein
MRVLILLVALLAIGPTATAQDFGSGIPMLNVQTGFIPDVLCQMDFNSSTSTVCIDSVTSDVCVTANSYNEQYTPSIEGTYSGYTIGDGGGPTQASMRMHQTDGNCDTVTHDKTTTDFVLNVVASSVNSFDNMFVLLRGSTHQQYRFQYNGSTNQGRAECGFGAWVASSAFAMDEGKEYNIRMNIDADTMDCDLYVDETTSGDWGVGAIYSICASGCDETSLQPASSGETIGGLQHIESATNGSRHGTHNHRPD